MDAERRGEGSSTIQKKQIPCLKKDTEIGAVAISTRNSQITMQPYQKL